MIRLKVNASNFSETVLDQNINSNKPGEAASNVKNVVTKNGGLFSGSLNLCCISGLSPFVERNKLNNIPVVSIASNSLL